MSAIPAYWMSKKDLMEKALTRRREKEAQLRQTNRETSKYLDSLQTKAVKFDAWTSDELFNISMEAYRAKRAKEKKQEMMDDRRKRLSTLLNGENEKYESEMNQLTKLSAKERRNQLEKLDLKAFSTTQLECKQKSWDDRESPISDFCSVAISYDDLSPSKEKEIEDMSEQMDRLALEKKEPQPHLPELYSQMEELKRKEAEAETLKLEHDALLQQQSKFQRLKDEREHQDAKPQLTARYLTHQYKAHLLQRTNEVLCELAEDRRWLEEAEGELEHQGADDRHKKMQHSLRILRKVIQEQVNKEKQYQIEARSLYNEEAAREWHRRELDWKCEKNFRRRLIADVLDNFVSEAEEKLARNVCRQEKLVKHRGQLLTLLERNYSPRD